ncbi:hypothetical protein, partial [Muribaculum intestinale]|uniref:hypothetical protein n=1 Tax=Muribaculum intestinale TaxID=1796646 RepID=UPI00242D960E
PIVTRLCPRVHSQGILCRCGVARHGILSPGISVGYDLSSTHTPSPALSLRLQLHTSAYSPNGSVHNVSLW